MDACHTIENGSVLRIAQIGFALSAAERRFLSPSWATEAAKNINLRPGATAARGATGNDEDRAALGAMMERYAAAAEALLDSLMPRYTAGRTRGSTSFRPVPIPGAQRTWRSDDRRLHVDSFPSNPVQGRRILRVFTNIDPAAEPRVWLVGEPFADFAARFFPRVKPPFPGVAPVLHAFGVTKSRRSAYDHFMLGMHDAAKADSGYQSDAPRETMTFEPGATWIAFTDQVVHAATRGTYALEQTFYVDVERMADRATSPLAVLERLAGRPLVA